VSSKPSKPTGVIGVGHLMRHLTPGLLSGGSPPELLLSPRGAETAAFLARRYCLEVAPDNRTIVERCDLVLVAVRPFQVADATRGLPWRRGQTVVSLCAGMAIPDILPHVAPARVVRAMPVTAAEFSESPTCVFPADPAVNALLARAGPVIALAKEADFEAASVMACYYTWTQKLINKMTGWLTVQGIDEATARRLVAAMTRAGATTVLERPSDSLDSLVEELCRPESYSLQGLNVLGEHKAFEAWLAAANALLARMRARQA
jgi:pyrroline-5-carboxylate reductase